MIMEDIVWKDDYGIGIEPIDNAHQEFFRIVRRLFMIYHQKKSNQWVAEEGIKFLKMYVMRHFQQEEEYMRSIGYKDIGRHAAQHEKMRSHIVPRLERQLAAHEYSSEAMEIFLNILTLWITRHILCHDKAIGWEKASPASI